MAQKGEEAASKFINALIKSLQTLCHGYLEFQNGIEIIGHINLSVDKGGSLDYILKEKVCKNAENSTLFISNSFHAEAKPEEIAQRRQSQSEGTQCVGPNASMHQSERGKVASAISSISSSLSGPREKHRRSSEARETQHKSSKRRSSLDQTSEFLPAKISHTSSGSVHSRHGSSPSRSKSSHQGLSTSDSGTSETLLPQTASVGDSSGIGVNLAGSVLEPVENQNDSDLARRDDDSDGDLEVTFIKEEYGQGDSSADFENSSGLQFVGASAQGDGSRFLGSLPDGSAAFTSGSFDHGQQFSAGDGGSNTSQPGPSGMRGVSGIQSFVNSLSAFGSLGAPGLPLSQIGASAGASRQNRVGGLPKTSGSNQQPGSGSYSKSHTSLQRAFALHREDKRKRQEGLTSEEDMKQRLELMSELLSLKGVSSTEDYKTALLREKRRLAKKLYRASLPEEKKIEIKEKDKLHKRMKRATRWAATASMTDPSQHFSDCSSDITSQKEFDDIPRTSSGFTGSFAAVGSVSVEGMHDKDQGTSGNASRHSCDSPRIPPRPGSGPGSEENLHSLGSESLPCDSGMGSGSGGGIPRLGPSCLGNIPRICSTSSSHIGVGTDPLESFATTRPGAVSSASMVFGSVGSVPWMDPVSFDTSSQGHRPMDHDGSQREGYNLMKLGQR